MTIGGPFDTTWRWPNIGTPSRVEAEPVPFVTDECRCPACTAAPTAQDLHPLQAITDAPPLVPDDTDRAMHRAAVEAGYASLEGYVANYAPRDTDESRACTCHVDDNPPQPCARKFALSECRAAPARRTILALTGLAGSGKSTAAAHLVNAHGFARVRFAGPLKDMMRALGLTDAEIDGDRKELPCALLGGKTPRHAMQTVGTEWGRNLIDPDLWIRAWQAAVARLPAGQPVVVDDCRFPNEAAAVRAAGGALVRIERTAGGTISLHSSEGQDLGEAIRVRNDGPIVALYMQLDELLLDQVAVGDAPPLR